MSFARAAQRSFSCRKQIRFDTRTATIVGFLEPSVPYPADTELAGRLAWIALVLSWPLLSAAFARDVRRREPAWRLRSIFSAPCLRARVTSLYGAWRRFRLALASDVQCRH